MRVSMAPWLAATCKGVWPKTFRADTFAPRLIIGFIRTGEPAAAAKCKAVQPNCASQQKRQGYSSMIGQRQRHVTR